MVASSLAHGVQGIVQALVEIFMGTTYTSRITVRCWKEHTCAGCGSTFAYRFQRIVSGQAGTAEAASRKAELSALNTLKTSVDQQPCPSCGLYQADMLGGKRERAHWVIFWILLGVLTLLTIINVAGGFAPPIISTILAVVCLLGLLAHFCVDFPNPNANLANNRALAQRRIEQGNLQMAQPGKPEGPDPGAVPHGRTSLLGLVLLALGLAALLVCVPELVRTSCGWPLNDTTSPYLVSPGDEVTVYMPQRITSIKGYWRGRAAVIGTVSGRPAEGLPAATNSNNWGNSISAKRSETSNSSRIWVSVRVPNKPDLADKTLDLAIHMETESPQMAPGETNKFDVVGNAFDHKAQIHLAPVGASATYQQLWIFGAGGAIVLTLAGSLALILRARAVKAQALPTKIYSSE